MLMCLRTQTPTALLEAMSVQCRPFYLPWELTVAIVTTVYIHPNANVSSALGQLLLMVTKQQGAQRDGVHLITGDFNKACLKTVVPKFHQHVKCATREITHLIMFTPTLSMPTERPPSPPQTIRSPLPAPLPSLHPPQEANKTSHSDHHRLAWKCSHPPARLVCLHRVEYF